MEQELCSRRCGSWTAAVYDENLAQLEVDMGDELGFVTPAAGRYVGLCQNSLANCTWAHDFYSCAICTGGMKTLTSSKVEEPSL